ncbi:entericidin [Pelagivirga sediminicola]|uniref:Entericidin n=1 Tax=Pelagivirga sediminicola TaxID=2170575 RepID=A0A2T7GBN7_9RHOB|nr:entericidin A/B family lipoprotein [Pelagivirga sediminicola]PVA11829.1 entericidin [Pelagivirga sediminicola]
MLRLTLAMVAILGIAACETTEGFGRDVQNAGEAIENEAE